MDKIFARRLGAFLLGAGLIGAALPASADQLFTAPDGSYSYSYPDSFGLDHEFADGTGDVTGVQASTPENGDVVIGFYARPTAAIHEASEATKQAVVDDYAKAVAVLPSITFQSAAMTTMLGQPAVDMIFENKRFGAPQINRFIATYKDGKEYNFNCFYSAGKAAQFAPACDMAVESVKLQDALAAARGTDASAQAAESADASGAACTKLELNRHTGAVSDLSSTLMSTDQSIATIERVQKAHQAMTAIEDRAGDAPSAQDCAEMKALAATLK